MTKLDIVFATATFVPPQGGTVVTGTHWPADDPIVRAYPQFFTDDARYGLASSRPLDADGYPVAEAAPAKKAARSKGRGSRRGRAAATETATAAPGEQRSRTKTQATTEKAGGSEDKPDPKAGEKADEKTSGAK